MTTQRFGEAFRAQIVAAARALIGTPFMHQGRTPGVGLDCAGVPIVVARQLGLLPDSWDVEPYKPWPDGVTMRAQCERFMEPVIEPRRGDVVLIAWNGGPPQHLGILTQYRHGGHAMVHAEGIRSRKVVETRLMSSRVTQIVAAYSMPGVA